jgi:hypothetical protein
MTETPEISDARVLPCISVEELDNLERHCDAGYAYLAADFNDGKDYDVIRPTLKDLIALARRALAMQGAGGWRDIASAPKDGTEVLLGFDHPFVVRTGQWSNYFKAWVTGEYSSPFANRPTRWQPLPPPPLETGKDTLASVLELDSAVQEFQKRNPAAAEECRHTSVGMENFGTPDEKLICYVCKQEIELIGGEEGHYRTKLTPSPQGGERKDEDARLGQTQLDPRECPIHGDVVGDVSRREALNCEPSGEGREPLGRMAQSHSVQNGSKPQPFSPSPASDAKASLSEVEKLAEQFELCERMSADGADFVGVEPQLAKDTIALLRSLETDWQKEHAARLKAERYELENKQLYKALQSANRALTVEVERLRAELEGDPVGTLCHVEVFLADFPGDNVVEKAMNARTALSKVGRLREALGQIAFEPAEPMHMDWFTLKEIARAALGKESSLKRLSPQARSRTMTPEERACEIMESLQPNATAVALFSVGLVSDAIRQAIAAERERCAKIVDAWAKHFDRDGDKEGAAMARDCAAAIRSLGSEG